MQAKIEAQRQEIQRLEALNRGLQESVRQWQATNMRLNAELKAAVEVRARDEH